MFHLRPGSRYVHRIVIRDDTELNVVQNGCYLGNVMISVNIMIDDEIASRIGKAIAGKLRRPDHVVRMDDGGIPKEIFYGRLARGVRWGGGGGGGGGGGRVWGGGGGQWMVEAINYRCRIKRSVISRVVALTHSHLSRCCILSFSEPLGTADVWSPRLSVCH